MRVYNNGCRFKVHRKKNGKYKAKVWNTDDPAGRWLNAEYDHYEDAYNTGLSFME